MAPKLHDFALHGGNEPAGFTTPALASRIPQSYEQGSELVSQKILGYRLGGTLVHQLSDNLDPLLNALPFTPGQLPPPHRNWSSQLKAKTAWWQRTRPRLPC
jgi:hypothetical protein